MLPIAHLASQVRLCAFIRLYFWCAYFRALPGALDGHFQILMPAVKTSVTEKMADSSTKIDTLQFLHIALYSHEAQVSGRARVCVCLGYAST